MTYLKFKIWKEKYSETWSESKSALPEHNTSKATTKATCLIAHNKHNGLLSLHLPGKKRVENNIPAHFLENSLSRRIAFSSLLWMDLRRHSRWPLELEASMEFNSLPINFWPHGAETEAQNYSLYLIRSSWEGLFACLHNGIGIPENSDLFFFL